MGNFRKNSETYSFRKHNLLIQNTRLKFGLRFHNKNVLLIRIKHSNDFDYA